MENELLSIIPELGNIDIYIGLGLLKKAFGGLSRKLFGGGGSGASKWVPIKVDGQEEWTDPTTNVRYSGRKLRKRGGMWGHGRYYDKGQSKLTAKGLQGSKLFGGEKDVGLDWGAGQRMRSLTGHTGKSPLEPWLKRIKGKAATREAPTAEGIQKFDLNDPESVKRWIRDVSGMGGEEEGKGWFTTQAQKLKQGMGDMNLEELVEAEGDVLGVAKRKQGEGVGKFVGVSKSLAESLGQVGGGKANQGQFLEYLTSGQGVQSLLDQMEGKLRGHEEDVAGKRKEYLSAGKKAGKGYREKIEEAKEGEYGTGRQASVVEGLMEDMIAENKRRKSMYEEDVMGSWGGVADPFKELAGEWGQIEDPD